ncbi:hypothetical protein SAMN02744778_04455 [Pantoea sp. GL120224-02]|nr:hypothetical protein SAMN02744778_04455 [Pantoea sp. GL120224-02]
MPEERTFLMKHFFAGMMIITCLATLIGCQQSDRPIGPDGRPNVPTEQPIPGGPMSKGPVGQPQA